MITKSHCPLWEIDYNIHKNNGTYFSDADVARTHLVTALLRRGILGVGKREGEETTTWNLSSAINRGGARKSTINPLGTSGIESGPTEPNTPSVRVGRNMTEEEFMEAAQQPGSLLIMLGSVACFFHREILPYRSYEMWTRVLTWDRKWIYIVTYFVEPGTVQPTEYFLQPWRKPKKAKREPENESIEAKKARIRRKIHATSIATYVIKKGRLTIPPEVVLQRSSLLPEKPSHAPSAFYTPSRSPTTPDDRTSATESPIDPMMDSHAETVTAGSIGDVLVESLFPDTSLDGDAWTWENVERERQRGLKYAKMFDGLNALRDEFDGGGKGALGIYGDLLPNV
jgi:hypothetical protein